MKAVLCSLLLTLFVGSALQAQDTTKSMSHKAKKMDKKAKASMTKADKKMMKEDKKMKAN